MLLGTDNAGGKISEDISCQLETANCLFNININVILLLTLVTHYSLANSLFILTVMPAIQITIQITIMIIIIIIIIIIIAIIYLSLSLILSFHFCQWATLARPVILFSLYIA